MTTLSKRNVFIGSIWGFISELYPSSQSPFMKRANCLKIFNMFIRFYFKDFSFKEKGQCFLNNKVSFERVCSLYEPTHSMSKEEAQRYWNIPEKCLEFTLFSGRLSLSRIDELHLGNYLRQRLNGIFTMWNEKRKSVRGLEEAITHFFKDINCKGIRKDLYKKGKFDLRIVDHCGIFILDDTEITKDFSFKSTCGFTEQDYQQFDQKKFANMFLSKFFPKFVKIS